MAKFYGNIGYAETVEVEPGIWEAKIIERPYYGDINRNTRKLENSGSVNDNVNISNEISIVADPYANEHVYAMRYIHFQGSKWKITNAEILLPRIVLSIGGLYNGE